MDVHLEFERHGDDSATVFELFHELFADVFELLTLFARGIFYLLLLFLFLLQKRIRARNHLKRRSVFLLYLGVSLRLF